MRKFIIIIIIIEHDIYEFRETLFFIIDIDIDLRHISKYIYII